MYKLRICTVLLAAVCCSCSDEMPQQEGAAAGQPLAPVTVRAPGAVPDGADVSVMAFRRDENADFRYLRTVAQDWNGNGTVTAQLPLGEYKFFFACGDGTLLQPDPVPGSETRIEEIGYRLVAAGTPGVYLPAGELFLQRPASDVDSVYRVDGTVPVTVSARLGRVVGRVDLVLKRGYASAGGYVPVAYPGGETILDRIASVQLDIDGAGERTGLTGTSGTAAHRVSIDAADRTEITTEGFARFTGPLVLPPSSGGELDVTVSILPAAGSTLGTLTQTVSAALPENTVLEVTLWLNVLQPTVEITVNTEPMTVEQDGETGVWD